ncbi:hydroxymethylbilane synthase [Caminicella sporogenes]|uniref:hydroxymethylbilane synthase n=1 Tax=Caminicella sporogenes TaxID=166485 RepID=UPI0025418DD5|nr:hydroxymethylbilane synthase [Caminicella sporogenes]WIF94951.1 hydroxymethylbilane synthase [Caminicella sporogenes]
MERDEIIVGTRGSELALTQTKIVIDKLKKIFPQLSFNIKIIKTTGDKILDKTLNKIGGKGLFVKEIENALLNNEIDLAVHSMKDVPSEFLKELEIGAVTEREDIRDVLLTKDKEKLNELKTGAKIGTSSLRRGAQILALRSDLKIKPIRGNIQTRINKMYDMELDGIVLAAAGIKRMGLEDKVSEYFDVKNIVPAVGQGALGIQIRKNDNFIKGIISKINDEKTELAVKAERSFMKVLNGGCHVPVGAYAFIDKDNLIMIGMVASIDGKKLIKVQKVGSINEPAVLGKEVALEILKKGGKNILKEIEGDM